MSIHDVEHSIGNRFRILWYREQFGKDLYDRVTIFIYLTEPLTASRFEAADLRLWLRNELKVDANERTCQTWLVGSWSTARRLMSIHDIEHSIGDRLRLPQYREQFGEDLYDGLAVALSERQGSVYLTEPLLLRQWYMKYHPDSGPLRISNANEPESLLGDDLRTHVPAGLRRALNGIGL